MRLVITSDFRFSLARDNSVWTRTTYEYPFWERYLNAFDSVRVVARAKHDPHIDSRYRAVTGSGVEFWRLPYYLGPEQFLLRRGAIRQALLSAVGESDALLCRVGSPLADELLSSFWQADRPYGLEVVGDPHEAMGPGTIRHPLRPLFRARAARFLRAQCSRAVAVAYVTRETLQRRYPCPAHTVGISDVGQLDFTRSPKVFTTNYSSVYCDDADFVGQARQFQGREQPRILFVGSLAQMYKGLDVLLKAVKLLLVEITPTVIIVGGGKHRAECDRRHHHAGNEGAVAGRRHFDDQRILGAHRGNRSKAHDEAQHGKQNPGAVRYQCASGGAKRKDHAAAPNHLLAADRIGEPAAD